MVSSRNVRNLFRSFSSTRGLRLLLPVLLVSAIGCGGSGAGAPAGGASVDAPDPVPGVPVDRNVWSVRFYSSSGQFIVDEFEIEFYGGRRGKHYFFGFFRDQYESPVQIPFNQLTRVDFMGQMEQSLFEQATFNREDLGLQWANAFSLRLHYLDGRQDEFFAFIPKFRGMKDFQRWEVTLSADQRQFDYFEILP